MNITKEELKELNKRGKIEVRVITGDKEFYQIIEVLK